MRLLIAFLLFWPFTLFGQPDTLQLQVNRKWSKSSDFIILKDSTFFKKEISDKIVESLKGKFVKQDSNLIIYKSKITGSNVFFRVFYFPISYEKNITLPNHDRYFSLDSGDTAIVLGFQTVPGSGKYIRNYSRFLLSAYMQELDYSFKVNENNFRDIPQKSSAEFWKRNLLNMGYGMQYIAKENPFMGAKQFTIGFAYLWETLHYIPIFAGPFIGDTKQDKIIIPAVGLASLILWKTVVFGIVGSKQINEYQSIINSGYRMPSRMEY